MNENALIFAPLEGITDAAYRLTIHRLYPQWDYLFTDFYRVPSSSNIPSSAILQHFGREIYEEDSLRNKTVFQLLASPNSQIEVVGKILNDFAIPWVDFNAGCPAKKVNAHHGGSWLLSAPNELKKLLQRLRASYTGKLSVKIRSGYHETSSFPEILKIIEGEGADLLTVHPRTKTQMYLGLSDWSFIAQAVQSCKIPIVGNGDLTSVLRMNQMQEETQCHSLMVGRAAVGDPTLAAQFKNIQRPLLLEEYFCHYLENLRVGGRSDEVLLKRLKAISHYLFLPRSSISLLLHCHELSHFLELLKNISDLTPNKEIPD